MSTPLAILSTGLVTSVGLSAPAACAAIRTGITNPCETAFLDLKGERILAHEVPLDQPWRGRTRLVKMAALALSECLSDWQPSEYSQIPLVLCVAERDRPGRLEDLDTDLFLEIQQELGVEFAPESMIVPQGRVSVSHALARAREILEQGLAPLILIAATDSLLSGPTLEAYAESRRLLTEENPDGFMPGEGAGALLVGPAGDDGKLICAGIGFGTEEASILAEQPLRGDGLAHAIKAALTESGRQMHEFDFRITDASGEQYYFKEAALGVSRLMRVRKIGFDIWHPAECTGETGAAAGATVIAVAEAACRKGYALGENILCHFSNDAGQRAATVFEYRG